MKPAGEKPQFAGTKQKMASSTKLVRIENQVGRGSISPAQLLTPAQAAELLGVPEGTLAQWRSQRRGPAFIKLEGRLVRYRAAHLEKYISDRVVETELTFGHA